MNHNITFSASNEQVINLCDDIIAVITVIYTQKYDHDKSMYSLYPKGICIRLKKVIKPFLSDTAVDYVV